MSTDGRLVAGFLQAAWRRRTLVLALSGAGSAVVAALAFLGVGWLGLISWELALGAGVGCVVVGAIDGAGRAMRTRARIAYDVERRAPDCRNLLITAAELLEPESVAKAEIAAVVEARAAKLVADLDPPQLFPLRRPATALIAGLAVWVALAAVARARPLDRQAPALSTAATVVTDVAPVIDRVEVVVTAPEYTGRGVERFADPVRLDVIAGSRLDVRVRGGGATVTLRTLDGRTQLDRADDEFRGSLVAEADGFLALQPRGADGRVGARRLIGLRVTLDAPPVVSIREPGEDLFLIDATRVVPVTVTAQDDFGVDSLRLAYTIVSGSGETFEFSEGDLPLAVERADARSWSATSEISLPDLGLTLGDMVVYRAVARDTRPGAVDTESDSFVIEIVSEGAAIAGGFALESDEQREALSQRMIIIKTERLLALRGELDAEEYQRQARRLAAEQRTVRAEFVFMMGGEIADEVEEAEHEHEVASGRLALRGRQEMSRAVLYMSQAAAMLTSADLDAALPAENAALEALQSALARSRYILRVLGERQRIDMARRLTGEPDSGAGRGTRASERPDDDPVIVGLRRLLADAVGLLPAAIDATWTEAVSDLAEATLRLDPARGSLQSISVDLAEAAQFATVGDDDSAGQRLLEAIDAMTADVEAGLPLAPPQPIADPVLAGALTDELRAVRGGR